MANGKTAADTLIVALDCSEGEAVALARSLRGIVRWLKIGMTLFYEAGPRIVEEVRELGFDVFLDLKLHDIPHQVEGAAARISRLGARMITVHASGGAEMISAAVRGAEQGVAGTGRERPSVLAVTVLTSMNAATLGSIGVPRAAAEQVPLLAELAMTAGADGVVCSPEEAEGLRSLLGAGALIVTPGVRPSGADAGDQSRVATPAAALRAGASHLVVGRPITAASDSADAARRIVKEMEGAWQ